MRRKGAILVHTMGKVGSSSIWQGLKCLGSEYPIFHTHFLNRERLENQIKKRQLDGIIIDEHLVVSQAILEKIAKGINDKDWKIITLVREPISRNISAFFQNLDLFIPNSVEQYNSGNLKMEEVISTFLAIYPHELPLNWLDWEIKSVFSIDVFSVDFPKSDGYSIFHGDRVDLLLLRLESLNTCCHRAFREFIGVSNFPMTKANDASQKEYYEVYKEFKNLIRLPEEYIETMYQSRYARHFYSEDELHRLRNKWLKNN